MMKIIKPHNRTVMENREFAFVDKPLVHKYSRLENICTETFMKYLRLTTKEVENKLAKELPDKIGIVLDGWSDDSSNHYVALFATYICKKTNTIKQPLLTIAPLLDPTSLKAPEHATFIKYTLELYGKGIQNILFYVEDNCESELTNVEKSSVLHFLKPSNDVVEVPTTNRLIYAKKIVKSNTVIENADSLYIDLNFVPATSNIVERLFSAAKHILTDTRKSMHPIHFEACLFLKINRDLWNVHTLGRILSQEDSEEDRTQ